MNSKSVLLFALALSASIVNAIPSAQAGVRLPRNLTREFEDAKREAQENLRKVNERLQQQQQRLTAQERELQKKVADRLNKTLNDATLRNRVPEEKYNKLLTDLAGSKFVPRTVSDIKHDASNFCAVLDSFNSSFMVAGSANGVLSFRVGWANAENSAELKTGDLKSRCFSKGKRFTYRVAVMGIYEANAPSRRLKLHEFKDKWSGFVRNETTIDNSPVIIFTNTLTPGGTWGNLKVTFRIATAADVAVLDDGSVAQPNRLEWGLKIENWPYASAANSVKVLMGVFSKLPRTVDVETRNVSIGTFGEFSWDSTAKINGVDTAITSSITSSLGEADALRVPSADANDIADETGSTIELTFPANAAVIDYDPELNTNEAALSSATTAEASGSPDPTGDAPNNSAERMNSSLFAVFASLLFSALMMNF